jgi:hypothetical protein
MSMTLLVLHAPNDGRADGKSILGNSAVAPIGILPNTCRTNNVSGRKIMGDRAGDLAHLGPWGLAR